MDGFLDDRGSRLTVEKYRHLSVMPYTHAHAQYEVYFCTRKVAQRSVINGVEYTYRYPCVILSAPFTVHSMSCDDPDAENFERYVFYFGESVAESFDTHLLPEGLLSRSVGLLFPLTEAQAYYMKQVIDLCDSEKSAAQRELTFVLFLNKLVEFCPLSSAVRVGTSSFYISDVLRRVSSDPADVDADRIAKEFSVSRSKLDRDFKRFTGMTFHSFAETCRLNRAKYLLLRKRNLSVGEVAEQCGFESETYFFPFFKKRMGMTPSEYRKNGESATETMKKHYGESCGVC